jgi:transposase
VTAEERIAVVERRLEEALRENAALREENARLRKELEEWKRGHRERSKRRSSRAEGCAKGSRKRPGRKAGHPGAFRRVPKPDRTVVHPLPTHCECGGHVEPTGETESTIVQEIPEPRIENVQHVAPVGACTKCHKRVVAKLPGAVRAGQSVAQVQLGPNAHSLILDLRYVGRMSLGGMVSVLGTWFGLEITKGGITQLVDRVRDRTQRSYQQVVEHIRAAGVVGLDETGLRQQGMNGWVWLARTQRASLFRIELSRGSWVAEAMLGEGFVGVVCSDFYGVYTAREDWRHGYCWGHTLREAKKIAEVEPTPVTSGFRDTLSEWYQGALAAQRRGRVLEREAAKDQLADILLDQPRWQHPDVQRLVGRLVEHFEGATAFVDDRKIPATNNDTEQDIRPIAVMRKVTGGTRSANGSRSLAHWMTITQTLHKNGLSVREYVIGAYQAHLRGRDPPSVFADR